ncbi:hypothetical protein GCM10009775_22050 [Microbacterium aoyamense]|uniref:DUF805 domain-containing protein n=1 Tax=Microbacterium aoyamense TaxID=344166 RepID=A0ABN2PU83_9MICO|nr:DUF805 domain-containing protein [Microbacterium aoyamense]
MTQPPAPQPAGVAGEPPLSQPFYGASFGQAFSRFWKKYATFTGRASRSEFWWWYLANVIVVGVLYALTAILGFSGATIDATTGTTVPGPLFVVGSSLLGLWGLAVLIPSLALAWRRLHDTNRSGGFWFLGLIPFVGWIILLVFYVSDSNPQGARFDV